MKRILFLTMLCLSAWVVQAQQDSTYHVFVERGKTWCVHGFNKGDASHTVTDYYFSLDEVMIVFDGHEYFKMCSRTDNGGENIVGWFREEDHRVYLYDEEAGREYKIYDFTLNVGDKFEPEYGDYSFCEVKKVGVIRVNGETLKTITFEANDRQYDAAVRVEVTWIEGIGHRSGPLAGLFSENVRNSWEYHTSYVIYDYDPYYLPLSFDLPDIGWHGCQLRPIKKVDFDETIGKLEYELVPDSERGGYALHVFGRATISCSPNQYVYCIEEDTEDPIVRKLTVQVEELEPYVDCLWRYEVDMYFHLFQPEIQYIAVDDQGEHPVPVHDKEVPYRPFIEEGKVWKVGWFPGATTTAQRVDSYYFEGDTIVGDYSCKIMKCYHGETNQPWSGRAPWTEYVGSIYEEGQRVYCLFPGKEKFVLLYDFASAVGDTIEIYNGLAAYMQEMTKAIIMKRTYNDAEYYKGTSTFLALAIPEEIDHKHEFWQIDEPNVWMEGVGNVGVPLDNVFLCDWEGYYNSLMSCTIGDEVIYGVTSIGSEVKKQWLDFTHTTKPRPKAPRNNSQFTIHNSHSATEEENLTGEYSAKELFVSLKPLTGPYTITLTDAAGNEVYRKEVQTSNVVALNTDLTKYAEGTYTLTVENAAEQYAATLSLPFDDVAVRDLPSSLTLQPSSLPTWTDLSGRQLSTPPSQKGVYIRDGRKILIK